VTSRVPKERIVATSSTLSGVLVRISPSGADGGEGLELCDAQTRRVRSKTQKKKANRAAIRILSFGFAWLSGSYGSCHPCFFFWDVCKSTSYEAYLFRSQRDFPCHKKTPENQNFHTIGRSGFGWYEQKYPVVTRVAR
jgi:hypothetical protein